MQTTNPIQPMSIAEELYLDTVISWIGSGGTLALALIQVDQVVVAISGAITIGFTLRRWWILERNKNKDIS